MKKLSKELLKNAIATESGFSVNDIAFEIDTTKTVNKGTSNRGVWNDYIGLKMTIHDRTITYDDMLNIASYMDDEIRENLHLKLAPCSNEKFIFEYIEKDKNFLEILKNEFNFHCEKYFIRLYKKDLLDIGKNELAAHLFNRG